MAGGHLFSIYILGTLLEDQFSLYIQHFINGLRKRQANLEVEVSFFITFKTQLILGCPRNEYTIQHLAMGVTEQNILSRYICIYIYISFKFSKTAAICLIHCSTLLTTLLRSVHSLLTRKILKIIASKQLMMKSYYNHLSGLKCP